MILLLKRRYLAAEYTIGELYIDGVYMCDTIEDKVRDFDDKVFGETAIPYGIYEVVLNESPKFKRDLPLLMNVPHFTGIRIHRGNTAKDSHGCILPGENKRKGMVINSGTYEDIIVEKMTIAIANGDSIAIQIR